MYSFPNLESVCCSMSSSNCCFLTCIQISQEAGLVFWYSHFFKNFPEFVVVHTVKGFGIVNKAEVNIFLERSCFFHDPTDVGNLISGSSAFSKSSLNIWKFTVHVLLKRLPLSDSITAQHCNTCNVWTQTLGLKDEVLGGVGSLPGSAVCVPVFEESILEWGSMQWPCLEV